MENPLIFCPYFLQHADIKVLQITYTSDYFQDLYDLAVELIRCGHAYVDHQVAAW